MNELKKILGLGEIIFNGNKIKELSSRLLEETKKKQLDSKIYNPDDITEDRKLYIAKLAKLC